MLKSKRINIINLSVIALLVVFVSYPLYTNYIIKGVNTINSLTRIYLISENIGKVFPIRIEPILDMSHGYGAVSFQADIFLIIPAILNFIGLSIQSAYKIYIFLINAATAVISYYCFSKYFHDKKLGLTGSILYTCCPLRCYDLYWNGILGQSIAWIFIPLIFLGSILFIKKEKASHILIFGFSSIIMSSITIFFFTAFMFFTILIVHYKDVLNKKSICKLFKIAITTFCICAWYLIPLALRMRDPVAVGCMLPSEARYSGKYIAEYLMPMNGAGIVAIFLIFVFLYNWFIGEYQKKEEKFNLIRNFLIITFIFILLSSRLFPWDLIQNKNMLGSIILAIMEVPERLSVIASGCIIFVACGTLYLYKDRLNDINMKRIYIAVVLIVFIFLQYQLGTLLYTSDNIYANNDILQIIPFQILSDVPIIWRISECISIISVLIVAIIYMLRRKNCVK